MNDIEKNYRVILECCMESGFDDYLKPITDWLTYDEALKKKKELEIEQTKTYICGAYRIQKREYVIRKETVYTVL